MSLGVFCLSNPSFPTSRGGSLNFKGVEIDIFNEYYQKTLEM